jgi:hypothetical protein
MACLEGARRLLQGSAAAIRGYFPNRLNSLDNLTPLGGARPAHLKALNGKPVTGDD